MTSENKTIYSNTSLIVIFVIGFLFFLWLFNWINPRNDVIINIDQDQCCQCQNSCPVIGSENGVLKEPSKSEPKVKLNTNAGYLWNNILNMPSDNDLIVKHYSNGDNLEPTSKTFVEVDITDWIWNHSSEDLVLPSEPVLIEEEIWGNGNNHENSTGNMNYYNLYYLLPSHNSYLYAGYIPSESINNNLTASVPEPASAFLFGLGLLGICLNRKI